MMPFPFRFQKLNADQVGHIQRALDAGVAATELARRYRVSVRTIFRVRHRVGESVQTVTVGQWAASFAIRDESPVQVEPWRASREALD
jgi:hypothetical protein